MNNVFLYRMPVGIAGAVSRPQDLIVGPVALEAYNGLAEDWRTRQYAFMGCVEHLRDGASVNSVMWLDAHSETWGTPPD